MLRSMYSGISGLRNFQTKLDVIGNNIANVNTMGFKKGRVMFKDVISQTVAGASAPGANRGGVNPKQVGLGSQISAIDTLHGQGSPASTGETLDLTIAGDGFFQVKDGGDGAEVFYTRAGNFYMDAAGSLVDIDGRFVQGLEINAQAIPAVPPATTGTDATWKTTVGKIEIPTTASSMSIGQDGTVYFVDYPKEAYNTTTGALINPLPLINGKPAEVTLQIAGKIQITKFANPGGLDKVGGNNYRASANSGAALDGYATDQGFGTIESGFLEMSNVDLAEEFTEMIIAQRGFQANTRIITTSDEILQELVNLKR